MKTKDAWKDRNPKEKNETEGTTQIQNEEGGGVGEQTDPLCPCRGVRGVGYGSTRSDLCWGSSDSCNQEGHGL